MFKIVQSTEYKWPVTVRIPTDGGRFAEHKFDAVFKRLSLSEFTDMKDRAESDAAVAREIVAGWAGVVDDNGDIPFSQDALNSVLDITGVPGAIVQAYLESVAGVTRKN